VSSPGAGAGFVVRGTVEHGDERGRTLGFPTANLAVAGVTIPDGVWAGWLARSEIGGRPQPAAISVGSRPTFYRRRGIRLIEAFVLDFEADLYDEVVTVWLAHRIRSQRRFLSVEELVARLATDVALTRRWCVSEHAPDVDALALAVGRGVALTR
jgi:FAD synthase